MALSNNATVKWHFANTVWVTLVNLALASVFVLFLFDVWTDTPFIQRAMFQGAQIAVATALVIGIALELRRSGKAWKWNVSAQIAAAAFPCAVFFQILRRASRNGVRMEGMEAMLLVYGFWIFVACGVTWFLYSRVNMSANKR